MVEHQVVEPVIVEITFSFSKRVIPAFIYVKSGDAILWDA